MAEHEYYEVNGRQIRVRPTESGQEIDEYGNFHRQPNHFTKGFGEGENPVEADRYILFWGKGCNWSNRASIARELLGLDIEDGTTDLAIIDPELVGEVLDTIKKAANEGYTMLLVSHEMNFVKNVATRVIFLENGKIIEDGPPKEVFNHPKSDRVREFFAKINRMVEPEYSI